MELEEVTDSDHISEDDQNILIQMLKSRLSQNRVTLDNHMKQHWNSVYRNHGSIRPDRIYHLLAGVPDVCRETSILKTSMLQNDRRCR
jgi:hypothetical protein